LGAKDMKKTQFLSLLFIFGIIGVNSVAFADWYSDQQYQKRLDEKRYQDKQYQKRLDEKRYQDQQYQKRLDEKRYQDKQYQKSLDERRYQNR
jgi:hypothetical protein